MPFELLERIGGGSHGDIYKARCKETGQLFAAKVSKSEWPTENANEHAMLTHVFQTQNPKNILRPVFIGKMDADHTSNSIIMPLCSFSLDDFLHKVDITKLNEVEHSLLAYHFLSSMLHALTVLDQLNIHHADIKPNNILWDETDKKWKLIDFGSARFYKPLSVETGDRGTPEFRAPEYFSGEPTQDGSWSDLYSIGKILKFLLGIETKINDAGHLDYALFKRKQYHEEKKYRNENPDFSVENILKDEQEAPISLFDLFKSIAKRMSATLPQDRPTLSDLLTLNLEIGFLLSTNNNSDSFDPCSYFSDPSYHQEKSNEIGSHPCSIDSGQGGYAPEFPPNQSPRRTPSPAFFHLAPDPNYVPQGWGGWNPTSQTLPIYERTELGLLAGPTA